MMDDFQLLYGNDDKIDAAMDAAATVFGSTIQRETYIGDWDANTNDPTLVDGTGTDGDYYTVITAGTQDLGSGDIEFAIGNTVKYDGDTGTWGKSAIASEEYGDVYLAFNNVFTAAQRGEIETLTYSTNITPNFALSNRYKVILTGNTVIENPTNIVEGQSGVIFIEQDNTGSRATTWGSYWNFANTYTEDTSSLKVNIFNYEVYSSTRIIISFLGTI